MTEKKKLGRNEKDTDDDMINLIDNLNRNSDLLYNRRSFIKTMVGTSLALGLATVPFSFKSFVKAGKSQTDKVKVANLSDVPKGSSITFSYPTEADTAILVHTNDGEFKAYNNKCTHLQCPVFYESKQDVLLCPCHRGYFDVKNGHPMAGPPQRELPLIELEVKGDAVYAVGRKVRHA